MSYFAAAVVRDDSGWTAAEVSLRGATDIDEVADRLRDVDQEADVSLLFVEADDAYLVVLRLDEGEDLRVFGSDSAYAEESQLGSLLVGDLKTSVTGLDGDEEPRPATTVTRRASSPSSTRRRTRSVTPICWPTWASPRRSC